ncbi:uncharacterized protein BP01DRAFT_137754 [Aspergillus saccharolyticus JOP 1030-1]|uniref:Uncharacterized protein n=1 Tax=Aspergillus saccharolyticus JOP 1030-1 TaxID=1450539 RepID=A0A318ZPX0_9EURO|nr:hypothetical protein BP01DRAFT_137754 [Aspergillus saccharolyticus JOP 1030-1]PYH42168.1 hypothetical protein BP01DRAFT_137754 [Aspergillus saccharolyticus JOP 1030-1]
MPLLTKASRVSSLTASDPPRTNVMVANFGMSTCGDSRENLYACRKYPTHVPYAPPQIQSFESSISGSVDSLNEGPTDSESLSQPGPEFSPLSMHASSKQALQLSLHVQDGSVTKSPALSQTNIAGRTSFGYSRENGSTLETTSPVSRSSLDFVFRSKTRSSMDPIARAATVQAARQAFEEKEAAKTCRIEAQQIKAEKRQIRQKERHWRTAIDPQNMEAISYEKPASETMQPSELPGSHSKGWKSQSKNTWVLFLTWFRTRVFKLQRRIRRIA